MKKTTKKYLVRLLSAVLVLIWMIIVFKLSNEPAETSSGTSNGFTKKIVEIFIGNRISNNEKTKIIKQFNPIIRKIAHYTLYTLGGIVILNFINTYNFRDIKKLLFSIIIGVVYACTDELHQQFVEGRSAEITDVFIDALGVATGVCIFLCIIKITSKLIKE